MKQRKDGRWQKKITLLNGKTKTLYSSAATERLAVKDFNEQMMQIEQKEKDSLSFVSVADKWNSEYREKISDINYRRGPKASYERIVEHFEDYSISEITPTEIHKYINLLIRQGFSHKTIATNKSTLNMIFTFAILNGYADNNPVQIITLPSNLPRTPRKMPTDAELKVVCDNYADNAFLPYFLLHTGLRKSEALALEYSDIDFENKTITVNKRLNHNGNQPVLELDTKTANSKRTVILLDRLAEKIPKNKKGIVFSNPNGGHLTAKQYRVMWENWQKDYGVNVTAHQLRHGYATMLYEAGIDLKDAQSLMGHSDIKTTQSIYTHIRDKRQKETATKLNNFTF